MTEDKKNLYKKLQEIQTQIKVYKDQQVAYKQTRYSFRSLEQILAEVKPLLELYGLFIKQSDEIEAIEGKIFVKSTSTIIDVETGEREENTAYAEIDYTSGMNNSQKTGSASSYARKYGLCGLLGIEGEKDADQHEAEKGRQAQKPAPRQAKGQTQKQAQGLITPSQAKAIIALTTNGEEANIAISVLKQAGYQRTEEIKVEDYERIYKEISRQIGIVRSR